MASWGTLGFRWAALLALKISQSVLREEDIRINPPYLGYE